MNHYIHVFLESAWVASVVPLSSEPTFFAMKSFGGFNMPLASALAILGATIGQLFNWQLGQWFLRLKKANHVKINDYWYDRIVTGFNQYGIFLLLFSWVSLCNLLVVLAGMAGTRLRIVLPLVLIGEIYHYGQYGL